MFNGLVLLPVILSLVGPKPHSHEKNKVKHNLNNGLHETHASSKNEENGTEMVKFIHTKPNEDHENVGDKLLDEQIKLNFVSNK